MTDTDLDFIEANQVMQAVDERLAKLYAQRERIAHWRHIAPPFYDALDAEDDQAIRVLESAKRKLTARWYADLPESADPITAAKAAHEIEWEEDGETNVYTFGTEAESFR